MRFKKFFKSRTVRVITAAVFILCILFTAVLPSFAFDTSSLPTGKVAPSFFNFANQPYSKIRYALDSQAQQSVFEIAVYQLYFTNFGSLRPVGIYQDTANYVYLVLTDPINTYFPGLNDDPDVIVDLVLYFSPYDTNLYSNNVYIYVLTNMGFVYQETLYSGFSVLRSQMVAALSDSNSFGQPSIARNWTVNPLFDADLSFNDTNHATLGYLGQAYNLWYGNYMKYRAPYDTVYDEAYQEGYAVGVDKGRLEGYDTGYDVGYDEGSTAGYGSGYDVGLLEGIESGYFQGYDQGYSDGVDASDGDYKDGYEQGYDDGYDVGYDVGYSHGDLEGYDSGYRQGFTDGRLESTYELDIGAIFDSFMSGTYNFIHTAFGFELFGVNISGLLMLIVGVVIIVFIVRFIWGFVK